MDLSQLNIQYFKNHNDVSVELTPGINCINGLNGVGKTNMLDSIHYLAFTKSAFLSTDLQNIAEDENYFLISGKFNPDDIIVKCYQERGKKKIIKHQEQEVDKIMDFIGRIPLILSTPYDSALIRDSSETRRKFIDGSLSQHDPQFLKTLVSYQKLLRQRNQFLKSVNGKVTPKQSTLLDVYDEQIITNSIQISTRRKKFLNELRPFFIENYKHIIADSEDPQIKFDTNCIENEFRDLYLGNRQKDIITMRTSMGAHKDDFLFTLNNRPIRKFGSQGQQKSYWLSLRFAQYDYLKIHKDSNPIMLLDDVFDKLDDNRILKLVNLLEDESRFGQVFITDARKERSMKFFEGNSRARFIEIIDGKIISH